MPLSPEIAVESCALPDNFHVDPADRIIVATARLENLILVTKDQQILKYGKQKFVTCLTCLINNLKVAFQLKLVGCN